MAWARLDDNFHDHPKVVGLDLAAVGLYTLALTWAHRQTRNTPRPGFIPTGTERRLAGGDATQSVADLVAAGMWDEVPGGWVIHDFADYLPTEKTKQERSKAGKAGAAKRWKTPGGDSNLPSVSHDVARDVPQTSIAKDGSRADAHREVLRTSPTPVPEPVPPSAGASAPAAPPNETNDQRAKRLAQVHYERQPMSKFLATVGVVKAAMRASKSDAEITSALIRMADEGRTVTVDSLRIEIEGFAPPRRPPPAAPQQPTSERKAAAIRAAGEALRADIEANSQTRLMLGGAA